MADLSKQDIEKTLNRIHWGTLTLESRSRAPYAVPVSFAWEPGHIFIHTGVKTKGKGKKLSYIEEGLPVSFLVVDTYSLIPSYFCDESLPCWASQCFASIMISGWADTGLSRERKIHAMKQIVRKLQPRPQAEPHRLKPEDREFAGMLDKMTVIDIPVSGMTTRAKFCQAYSPHQVKIILENLKKRGTENDLRTREMIKQYASYET